MLAFFESLLKVVLVLLGTVVLILLLKGMAYVMGDRSSQKESERQPGAEDDAALYPNLPKNELLAIIAAAISEHSGAKGLRVNSIKHIKSE
ncbi:MAG TPA: hypothetical protein GXZ61_03195 [Clostridiales bacterium]|jgi:Na+-transporting methylmalonyl-CoA/oxaloacetate decarboxylase gamma subunit|nr:hypothetical protein [Clostridiales bacterium]